MLILRSYITLIALALMPVSACLAQVSPHKDSFFLAKKKGLLGRLGRSISTSDDAPPPEKTANRYKRFNGKIIRSIEIASKGINEREFDDTITVRANLPTRIAEKLHKTSTEHLVNKNLFFRIGEPVAPLLIADNERFLRELPYLQNAWITIFAPPDAPDSVDVLVVTKDVFSIGGKVNISSSTKGTVELDEENLAGEGNRASISFLYDGERHPSPGIGASFLKRNIRGTFTDWTTGFSSFNQSFNTYRNDAWRAYTILERPLVTRYSRWTGAMEFSWNKNFNAFYTDSLYKNDLRYSNQVGDFWLGYNFGTRGRLRDDAEKKFRHFVAVRTLYTVFTDVPDQYRDQYNYRYADINGLLAAYTLYRQNYYRTNFIYGFGRVEDVPEGLSASLISGYINKQGVRRGYYGIDMEGTSFHKQGGFTALEIRTGSFVTTSKLEDIDLLISANHFTKLRRTGRFWRNRHFAEFSFTKQLNVRLNEPLFLRSEFGLPYFRNGYIEADTRATLKLESVFFNLRRFLGFRFAPFVFGNASLITPNNVVFSKSDLYSALGGGFRTRNENLIFGTMEVKGYIFPKISEAMKGEGMANWRVELNTNLKFKYNSTFIHKPTFIVAN
jgi:hypothetical protein